MSRINGDKARAALQWRRRIVQRMKDRAVQAATPRKTQSPVAPPPSAAVAGEGAGATSQKRRSR